MPDPIVIASALGIAVSPVAVRVPAEVAFLPESWRRAAIWLAIGGAVAAAAVATLWSDAPAAPWIFIVLLGALPSAAVSLVSGTALAGALAALIPLYFGIGQLTLGRPLHTLDTPLDRVMPLQPGWMIVYGSMYVFALLPMLLVRERELGHRAMRAYLTVLIVAYIGFIAYPTIGPRPASIPAAGFGAWCLQLQYAADWRYNCFPSLHVAHSFVSALVCGRVHRGVGVAALVWASLIAISTVYTKQHYAVDAIAGAFIACVAYVVFVRSYPRDRVPARDRERAPRRALAFAAAFALLVGGIWLVYTILRLRA